MWHSTIKIGRWCHLIVLYETSPKKSPPWGSAHPISNHARFLILTTPIDSALTIWVSKERFQWAESIGKGRVIIGCILPEKLTKNTPIFYDQLTIHRKLTLLTKIKRSFPYFHRESAHQPILVWTLRVTSEAKWLKKFSKKCYGKLTKSKNVKSLNAHNSKTRKQFNETLHIKRW